MKCPNCDKEISTRQENCPFCKEQIYCLDLRHGNIKQPYRAAWFGKDSVQIDGSIMLVYLVIGVPFLFALFQEHTLLFTDFIAAPVVLIITLACNIALIPWFFSGLMITLFSGIIKCIKEQSYPRFNEICYIAGVFVLFFLYTLYGFNSYTIIITGIAYLIRMVLKYTAPK